MSTPSSSSVRICYSRWCRLSSSRGWTMAIRHSPAFHHISCHGCSQWWTPLGLSFPSQSSSTSLHSFESILIISSSTTTTHGVASLLMRNQRADRSSVETLAYISCQATDHTLSRYRPTLPLPSQTPAPAPLRITWSGRPTGWPTHGVLDSMAHHYTGQLAVSASVDWSNKCTSVTTPPRNSH